MVIQYIFSYFRDLLSYPSLFVLLYIEKAGNKNIILEGCSILYGGSDKTV